MTRRRTALVLALCVAGSAARAESPARLSPVCTKTGSDGVIVAGKHVHAGELNTELPAILPDRRRPIQIDGTMDVPYRCIGGLIYTLQRLGYLRVGFVAEPPLAIAAPRPR